MARIRTVKPEFWTSEQVMECSPNARLLFIGLWNFCDDHGRHAMSPRTIKAEIMPGDDFTTAEISEWLQELSQNDLIETYVVDGKEYLQVTGWHHQRIDKPQKPKHPAPIKDHSKNDQGPFVAVEEGKGKEGKGEDIQTSSGAGAPSPSLFPEHPSPDRPNGGKPKAAAGGESAEELFWGLLPEAERHKVTRSLMGKLLQALGDPDRAYDALRKALGGKDARHYIGGVIRREQERREASAKAASGLDTGEPAFVQAARREGARVDVRDDLDAAGGAWEINGIVFDGQGQEIGF